MSYPDDERRLNPVARGDVLKRGIVLEREGHLHRLHQPRHGLVIQQHALLRAVNGDDFTLEVVAPFVPAPARAASAGDENHGEAERRQSEQPGAEFRARAKTRGSCGDFPTNL